jgi:hypothetical protein
VALPLTAWPAICPVSVSDGIPFDELVPLTVIEPPAAFACDSSVVSSDWK